MKEISTKDLFYNLDDVINLFKNPSQTAHFKGKKIKRNYLCWTKDSNDKLIFFINKKNKNN